MSGDSDRTEHSRTVASLKFHINEKSIPSKTNKRVTNIQEVFFCDTRCPRTTKVSSKYSVRLSHNKSYVNYCKRSNRGIIQLLFNTSCRGQKRKCFRFLFFTPGDASCEI